VIEKKTGLRRFSFVSTPRALSTNLYPGLPPGNADIYLNLPAPGAI